MTTITIERSLLERLYLYWLEDADPHELDEFTAQVRAALSAPATAPEVTLQGQVSEPVIAPKDCLWSRNGHQCCPTSPQSSQPERKPMHEGEIQAGGDPDRNAGRAVMTNITIDRKFLEEVVELFDSAITARHPHEILRDIRAALAAPATAPDEQLRKDSERYRWLRSQHWSDGQLSVVVNAKASVRLGANCPSHELLDEAIDSAMKGKL